MPTGPRIRDPQLKQIWRDQVNTEFHFAPLAADVDWFKTSTSLSATTTFTLAAASMTKSVAPNHPVCPVLYVTNDKASGDDSWTSVTMTVVGTDQFGRTENDTDIAATLSFTGGTDTWTATCLHAYSSLTSLAFTVVTGDGEDCDTNDSYTFGFAKTYGLGCKIGKSADVLVHNFNNANDDGTISATYNTYVIAGTPDASKTLDLVIRSSRAE